MQPLFDAILKTIPLPQGDPAGPLQILVANLDYSDYLGRLAIARVFNGTMYTGEDVVIAKLDGSMHKTKITKLFSFLGTEADRHHGDRVGRHCCGGWRGRDHHRRDHYGRRESRAAAADRDRRADHRDDVHGEYFAIRGARRNATSRRAICASGWRRSC